MYKGMIFAKGHSRQKFLIDSSPPISANNPGKSADASKNGPKAAEPKEAAPVKSKPIEKKAESQAKRSAGVVPEQTKSSEEASSASSSSKGEPEKAALPPLGSLKITELDRYSEEELRHFCSEARLPLKGRTKGAYITGLLAWHKGILKPTPENSVKVCLLCHLV